MSSPEPLTLKLRALRAGGWTFAGHGLSQAIRLGSTLIMTRLLAPEMFGVMTIATMVTVLLSMLSDIGVNQNIVQSRRGDDPVFLDTAWVVQILRGVALWLLALLLSMALYLANLRGLLPAQSVYASPELPLVIAVSSLSAAIFGFRSTGVATALRGFDQKRLVQIELGSQLAALLVMIAIGAAARSIWALVAGGLVASMTTLVLSHTWMRGHRNRFRWEKDALRELFGFGKWVFVSSAVFVLAVNGDRLLLGGLFGADILGLYAIAVLIVGAIQGGLYKFLISVSLPMLSEIARDEPSKLREIYNKLCVPTSLLLLFAAGALYAAGQLVIDLLYDPRYSAAGGMLQILAWTLFTERYGVAHQVYLAVGKTHYLAVINVARFISLYALVPLLYHLGGVQAAIWGVALHGLATLPFIYAFNARLGLNDIRRELLVLGALPAGFLCGSALNLVAGSRLLQGFT